MFALAQGRKPPQKGAVRPDDIFIFQPPLELLYYLYYRLPSHFDTNLSIL